MTKDEFLILNSLYNGMLGRAQCHADIEAEAAARKKDVLKDLEGSGMIDPENGNITEKGKTALEPYRVSNAVILAAGASTRFIPLSLEQPKGLYEVKGEKLIERQINQLIDAGITDITVVLGYKKEMFFFLEEKYGVKLVINNSFNIKNNIESLYLARKELSNTYICVSDSYFVENPFNSFEYDSFNAGLWSEAFESEISPQIGDDGRVMKLEMADEPTKIFLGHSYWTREFCKVFIELAEADREIGKYDSCFWEQMVKDNLDKLPPLFFKEFSKNSIFEFDFFEDLRKFDHSYLGHTNSEIIRNIKLVFRCDEEDIVDFRNVSEGLTNISFIFRIAGIDYIYRHPGEGTESIVNRKNEKKSLVKAKDAGVDPTYIYMDVNEGWKISKFITEFREPDYSDFEDTKKILAVLRKLHSADIGADYGMKPWEDAEATEKLLKEKDPGCFEKYEDLKSRIRKIYKAVSSDSIKKCFCHGDTYKPNWMIRPDGEVILIDWEYAGWSDPGIDVGYYAVDAMYSYDDAERFVDEYLEGKGSEEERFHFMAYIPIIAYYWFVWALYRESCGAVMRESLTNWLKIAEEYSEIICEKFNLEGK